MDLYCTQCHRECRPAGDGHYGFEEVSDCHRAKVLQGDDKWIVMSIRRLWAADSPIRNGAWSSFDPDFPFGTGNVNPVQADLELLDAFKAERQYHDDDLKTIWALIRG